jgi:glucose/arabinose dehydrogenase
VPYSSTTANSEKFRGSTHLQDDTKPYSERDKEIPYPQWGDWYSALSESGDRIVHVRTIFWILALTLFVITACTGDDDPTPTPIVATPAPAAEQPSPTPQPDDPDPTPVDPEPTPEDPTPAPEEEPTPVETPTEAVPEEEAIDLYGFEIDVDEVTGGLNAPVGVVSANDGSNRIFIIEKDGTISVVQDGRVQDERFLGIPERVNSGGSEQGLLGLAFHPNFAENNQFFVNYTDTNGDTVISHFAAEDDGNRGNPESEDIIMQIEQPASNHNGGHLLFGPDGYLYIGMGDGGGAGDTYGNAQNGGTLLGAMLRIDVDGDAPYGIPGDNPFLDNDDVRDEIWAIGLRNPWRYDFDAVTSDLHIADVGQNRIEEVNFQPADSPGGENYGWPIMEGSECYQADDCDQTGLILPVTEYTRDMGCSITGGNVYRGADFPEMAGVYFFSDFCSGNIWGLVNIDGEWQNRLFLETGFSVTSFGEDESGELYLVDMNSGILYQIVVSN